MTESPNYEKLGAFYLGREVDPHTRETSPDPLLYDARDLTTHAVCLGMTGSGKTGLCVDLLEEAALDDVPAILIDPKGDITNLALRFPGLTPEEFEPWINEDDARRKGLTKEEFAAKTATMWREGLASWGQTPERIERLNEAADIRIYTPGSDAGLQVSILSSLNAPALDPEEDGEALREQIEGTVGALLGLLGIDADPLQSREHILLSSIFDHFWREGKDLDLATLIVAVQNPPMKKLGVFEVDTFFPAKERFALAMRMNGILAAPSFQSWLEGEALDVASLLRGPDGKARHSVFYIAHLSDEERMFFVTLLLENVLSWMRRQSGTTSLRALLYMDEVFGYFPPVANPPSKKPLLTLMKQARAFGVGCVLATQNPVDIDYKGLTNAGTWFLGKLQTERDKKRVLDGLSQAAGGLDARQISDLLSTLASREFVLHNVHEDSPVVFKTRWAMSYLRGPLTKRQIEALKPKTESSGSEEEEQAPKSAPAKSTRVEEETREVPEGWSETRPGLSPSLPQVFLRVRRDERDALAALEDEENRRIDSAEARLAYEPALLASGQVSFVDKKRGVDETRSIVCLLRADEVGRNVAWEEGADAGIEADALDRMLEDDPEERALFAEVPERLAESKTWKSLSKDYSDHLYRDHSYELLVSKKFKLYAEPGESNSEFRQRVAQMAREERDEAVEKMRDRFEKKLETLRTRLEKEKLELEADRAKLSGRRKEELMSAGESLLRMFGLIGRRRSSGLSKAATKRRMVSTAKAGVRESEAEIERLERQISDLRRDLDQEVTEITAEWDSAGKDSVDVHEVNPRRADVDVDLVTLAWLPFWRIREEGSRRGQVESVAAWLDD